MINGQTRALRSTSHFGTEAVRRVPWGYLFGNVHDPNAGLTGLLFLGVNPIRNEFSARHPEFEWLCASAATHVNTASAGYCHSLPHPTPTYKTQLDGGWFACGHL
jgi:hypothetical protein